MLSFFSAAPSYCLDLPQYTCLLPGYALPPRASPCLCLCCLKPEAYGKTKTATSLRNFLSVVWLATELWKVPTQRQGRCSLIGQKIFCALRCFLLVLKSELELRALVYLALLRSKFLARAAFEKILLNNLGFLQICKRIIFSFYIFGLFFVRTKSDNSFWRVSGIGRSQGKSIFGGPPIYIYNKIIEG